MQQYGYIRVSTREQNPERQLLAMQDRGIPQKCIYLDKMSGKDFQRTGYQKLMKKLKTKPLDILQTHGIMTLFKAESRQTAFHAITNTDKKASTRRSTYVSGWTERKRLVRTFVKGVWK